MEHHYCVMYKKTRNRHAEWLIGLILAPDFFTAERIAGENCLPDYRIYSVEHINHSILDQKKYIDLCAV